MSAIFMIVIRSGILAQDDHAYSKAYIEEELSKFKASVREEMERELEDKLKWISLGAGIGATGLVGGAGMGAGGEMPAAREGFKQAAAEEGFPSEEEYRTEEGYGSEEDYEPAPFVFADLLDSMAEEYADMNLDERMEELGEPVMEITLEELAAYVKEKRKK